jgi:hypothetical protein
MAGQPVQVKEIEAAALRAAHDGALQIENAMAAAADKVPEALLLSSSACHPGAANCRSHHGAAC